MNMLKKRGIILIVIICLIAIAFTCRLFNLQIVHGSEFVEMAQKKYISEIDEEAPRGGIYDRYGRPLVVNKVVYSLQVQKLDFDKSTENDILLRLLDLLKAQGYERETVLPISSEAPYVFTFEGTDKEKQQAEAKWKKKSNFKSNMTAQDVIQYYADKYQFSKKYTEEQKRQLADVRYEMIIKQFSTTVPYEIAKDVNMNVVTKVKEDAADFANVLVVNEYEREYEQPALLAHLLGRIGPIYEEEYASLKQKDYRLNDYIGKQGLEKVLEDDLRGQNGKKRVIKNKYGEVTGSEVTKEPVPGNNAILTIDIEMQQVLEESLKDTINSIRENAYASGKDDGRDAAVGSSVVIDVNTGEILAMASYPSYNLETFNKDYSSLLKDKNKPLINRALSGTYEPGSTFKMVTASAALQKGSITPNTKITDLGIYRYYKGYQPACWIWTEQHRTHGTINVSQALMQSCNYFFYETGRLTGINDIVKYGKLYGLGSKTGIELSSEEAKGNLAGPKEGTTWNPGDTLQAAIGQSTNLFTPLQLTNYIATVANGGTRYTPHLVKGVRSATTGQSIRTTEPTIKAKLNLNPSTLQAIQKGMLMVTQQGGTAHSVFADFPLAVAAKTGTAQVSTGSDNGIFAAYAPYDNPQIAVVTIIEHGTHGNLVAKVARKVMDYYFSENRNQTDDIPVNQLLP